MKGIVYKGADKQWYWHLANKGRTVADGEGHASPSKAMRALQGLVTQICKPCKPVFKVDEGLVVTWTVQGN
jgi:uncharacterized protein YegP (UPF0339 family)